jgi:membrane protease YdiL (CAAX protease family)
MGAISPCVCGLLGSALETGTLNSLSQINELTWGVLITASVGVLPDILASIGVSKSPGTSQQDCPAPMWFLSQFTRYVSIILLVCYLVLNQPSGLSSVGVQLKTADFVVSLFGSVIVYSCFILIYSLGYRLVHKRRQEIDLAAPGTRAFAMQRTVWERIVFLPILFLGVIGEELLYRGYLVLFLGNETNSVLLWALLSVVLSMATHLYQGRSLIVYHLLFATIAVSMTVLTGSIVMSTTMHLYANLTSALKVWSVVDKTIAKQEDATISEPTTNKAI